MLRLLCCTLVLLPSIYALQCHQGNFLAIDGKAQYDDSKITKCSADVTQCLKEKISTTGESGHTILLIRYTCDNSNDCAKYQPTLPQMTNNCKAPFDVYIGDLCCCNSDGCNTNVSLNKGGAGLYSLLLISFAALFLI